jgi:hypothetical protein
MLTEFELIFEEFSAELDALSEMTASPGKHASELTSRARIAAGNAATLLLAAVFEEYVRQQVKAAFKEKSIRAKGISDFPNNIASKIWRRALETLARTQFEEVEGNARIFEERFAAVVSFSIKKDVMSDVSDAIAHNENNMRPTQLSELFNQIGISKILHKICDEKDLLDHLNCDEPEKARTTLVTEIEEFFRRRNHVAHAIKLGSSSGPLEISQDIELFRVFGQSLFRALNRELPPESDVLDMS